MDTILLEIVNLTQFPLIYLRPENMQVYDLVFKVTNDHL